MKIEELMDEFAAEVKLPALSPDKNGVYGCEIDGLDVYICATDDERLVIWADLCDPVQNGREELYRLLFESSFLGSATAGGSFAINPESGQVSFQRFDELSVMTTKRFIDRLEEFVRMLKHWKNLVTTYGESLAELEKMSEGTQTNHYDILMGQFQNV